MILVVVTLQVTKFLILVYFLFTNSEETKRTIKVHAAEKAIIDCQNRNIETSILAFIAKCKRILTIVPLSLFNEVFSGI